MNLATLVLDDEAPTVLDSVLALALLDLLQPGDVEAGSNRLVVRGRVRRHSCPFLTGLSSIVLVSLSG